jgi:hypothetical protein
MRAIIYVLIPVVACFIYACANHNLEENVGTITTDASLFNEISQTSEYYYQEGAILNPAPASPHSTFKLRFNEIAWSVLDETGELPAGSKFPEGSVIIKEVYSSGSVALYAVMKKNSVESNAAEGWLWAEYLPNGQLGYSIGQKGLGCTNCHSQGTHRDLVRTFDLH